MHTETKGNLDRNIEKTVEDDRNPEESLSMPTKKPNKKKELCAEESNLGDFP